MMLPNDYEIFDKEILNNMTKAVLVICIIFITLAFISKFGLLPVLYVYLSLSYSITLSSGIGYLIFKDKNKVFYENTFKLSLVFTSFITCLTIFGYLTFFM